jgi:CheY-like chemotaxis protein
MRQSRKISNGAGGSGLHLSICHEIMRTHHGTIEECNNQEGRASFVLQPKGTRGVMAKKILIFDDEVFNLEIIRECFEGTAYDLHFFKTGEAGWDALSAPGARFDLAILDCMMPGLDGLSLLKKIKADHRFGALPVIMQTAAALPEQLREGMQAGAHYYLTKPYECDSLRSIVRASLSDAAAEIELQRHLRDYGDSLQLLQEGSFELQTVEEASRLAHFLARATTRPELVALGLSELLLNSVEHGNLGISYQEKSELKRRDQWREELERRLILDDNRNKRVRVRFQRCNGALTFSIGDEGQGFAWNKYLEFDPERAFDPNGRGIAIARLRCFDTLEYQGCGNTVVASIFDEKVAGQD